MENLIVRFRNEAGLTEDQSVVVLKIIKEYMDGENIHIDWNKFFKGKYNEFLKKSRSVSESISNNFDDFSDDISEDVKGLKDKIRTSAKNVSQRIYGNLNENE